MADEKTILIGTSPEFELAAYTLLALTNTSEATFTYDGFSIDLTVQTLNDNGVTRISKAYPGKGSGSETPSGPPTKSPGKPGSSDQELQQLVNNMRASDEDKPQKGDITMNWGNKVSGTNDASNSNLFTSVNENIFSRPVYAKLIAVYNAKVFNPQVCDKETAISGNKKALLDAVTKEFVNTTVFKLAFKYLTDKGKVTGTIDDFYPTLFQLWFGTYTRCHGTLGSSGWEHVFSGEWKGSEIDGQHDWVRYYLLQKSGDINYHGYDSHDSNLIGTFQYTWDSYLKKIGGFFTDTSPSFDFSVLTVCALVHSGSSGCRFNLDGYPIYITSYTQECDGGRCLSTAYPSDNK
uniref:Endoribonuclease n=1 Tax=Strongyloides venezuelensis TaxID=75913 RepID=A0A0K0F3R8_STRVS